jgi:hypothetical protein
MQPPSNRPLLTDDLEVIFRAETSGDGHGLDPTESPIALPHPRRSLTARRWPAWSLFLAGLLVGWIVIGWWIWPVHWTNSSPWDMSTKYQRTFVQLIADRYWTTRDLAQAEAALSGWGHDDVNGLIVAMQTETLDTEARQHLTALLEALKLPGGEQSLLTSIFNQGGIVFAFALAALPLIIAVGLVVAARVRSRAPAEEAAPFDQEGEAELEELLADVQLDAADGGGQPGQEQEPGQPPKPEEEQPPQQEEEEEKIDAGNPLGDLASLFEEEDTSLVTLEAMCKGMPEVSVDDLVASARNTLHRFKEDRR